MALLGLCDSLLQKKWHTFNNVTAKYIHLDCCSAIDVFSDMEKAKEYID